MYMTSFESFLKWFISLNGARIEPPSVLIKLKMDKRSIRWVSLRNPKFCRIHLTSALYQSLRFCPKLECSNNQIRDPPAIPASNRSPVALRQLLRGWTNDEAPGPLSGVVDAFPKHNLFATLQSHHESIQGPHTVKDGDLMVENLVNNHNLSILATDR